MGYSSKVAITCEGNAFKLLKEACDSVKLMPDKCYKSDDTFVIFFNWITWYEGYEDVQAVIRVFNKLDELHDPGTTDGYGYKFLRLGENDSDTEERCNSYDIDLWQTRYIDLPACTEEIGR